MKYKDIQKLEEKDLHKELEKARVKLRELRFSVANNQLKKVRDIRNTKKTIAKILTVLNNSSKEAKPQVEETNNKQA